MKDDTQRQDHDLARLGYYTDENAPKEQLYGMRLIYSIAETSSQETTTCDFCDAEIPSAQKHYAYDRTYNGNHFHYEVHMCATCATTALEPLSAQNVDAIKSAKIATVHEIGPAKVQAYANNNGRPPK